MAKKLSVDLTLNAQGFKQGINEAKGATAQYTNATRDLQKETEEYLKSFGSLRKQFGAAKKEAQNLAAQFMALGEAERKSEYGQELAQSLDIAIRKAAELQDVMADTNQAIKNASSDTQGMDALKDALDIGKDLATAYAGAVAKLTGSEKAYKDMIANVAMIQGGFNAAIKTYNALQPQSNLLIAIGNIQLKAKAVAETLATKTTKEATIAQRVFNAVAKANPYVLLATAAIAAATAIGGYMLATKKSAEEEKRHKRELEELKEAQDAYTNSFKNTATNLIIKYRELQASWNRLKTELEKTQFIKKHVNDFKELGGSVKTVNDANDFLVKQTKQVEAALMARAKAAAYAAQAQVLYGQGIQKSLELEELYQKKLKAYSEIKGDKKETITITSPTTGTSYSKTITKSVTQQLQEIDSQFQEEEDNLKKGMEDAFRTADSLVKKGAELVKDIPEINIGDSKIDKQIKTRYEKLKKAVEDIRKEILNLDENAPDFQDKFDALQEKLYKAQQVLENFEKKHGIIHVDMKFPDTKVLMNNFKKYYDDFVKKANEVAKKNPIIIKSKQEFEDITSAPIKEQQVQKILDKVFNPDNYKGPDYEKILNFPQLEKTGEKLIKKRDDIVNAITQLRESGLDKTDFGKKALQQLEEEFAKVDEQLGKLKDRANVWENLKQGAETVGNSFNALGDLFSSLGDTMENTGMKATGLIFQTIATLSLSFAKALSTCSTWVEWLAFGISGMATLTTMIGQIKALNMNGYEQGGVIPGSSFTGDKLLAAVNSGERILTAKQNENLEKIANGTIGNGLINNAIRVEGVIRGKDLLLVQKNYNTIGSKAGQNININ